MIAYTLAFSLVPVIAEANAITPASNVALTRIQGNVADSISVKKRLTKKRAAKIYLSAVCPTNSAKNDWSAYDSYGNFDASLMNASAENYTSELKSAVKLLSHKKWPKKIKTSWVKEMIRFYRYEIWIQSGYLDKDTVDESDYLSITTDNPYNNGSWSANKIRKALQLPPAPSGCSNY